MLSERESRSGNATKGWDEYVKFIIHFWILYYYLIINVIVILFSVENWDQCESMLDYIYSKCLSVESNEHPVMMSEVAVRP